jgi:flavin-dependent dehydrogenase
MSGVRKALGITQPQMAWGMMAKANSSLSSKARHVTVYFNKDFSPDGFAWAIPQNEEMGMLSSVKPMEYFQRFLSSEAKNNEVEGRCGRVPRGDINSRRHVVGAPIPIGTCRSYADRAILVGDAAGQVKPLTGGGIVWGLRCADIAARAIEYAFDANRYDAFFWKTEYERKWQAAIGREFKKQLAVRKIYGRMNNSQLERLFDAIRPELERAGEFDYDALSGLVRGLPKLSLARIFVPSLLHLS